METRKERKRRQRRDVYKMLAYFLLIILAGCVFGYACASFFGSSGEAAGQAVQINGKL
jgi:F0F1-type ATP synthase assembly protein I